MDTIGMTELRQLTAHQPGPCVSLYMPTHVAGEQQQQDGVRLKNLLRDAEERLSDGWLRPVEARELLQPLRDLPRDRTFWNARGDGLALFLNRDRLLRFRLPQTFDEWVMVSQRFHVKPLLPLVSRNERCFLLALSQNQVRLYAVTSAGIEPVEVKGLPMSLDSALNNDGADRGSQAHSAERAGVLPGKQGSVFHGQGGVPDAHKDDLIQFFRRVDATLQPILRDEQTPLVLAGVAYLLPIYRQVNSYAHLAKEELTGNCEYLTDRELHQRAWSLMQPEFSRSQNDAAARFRSLAGTGKTSDDVNFVLPAACEGRIESLFLDVGAHVWGKYHHGSGTMEVHAGCSPGDDDLLDAAAVETLDHGGTIFPVAANDLPAQSPVAAIFRY